MHGGGATAPSPGATNNATNSVDALVFDHGGRTYRATPRNAAIDLIKLVDRQYHCGGCAPRCEVTGVWSTEFIKTRPPMKALADTCASGLCLHCLKSHVELGPGPGKSPFLVASHNCEHHAPMGFIESCITVRKKRSLGTIVSQAIFGHADWDRRPKPGHTVIWLDDSLLQVCAEKCTAYHASTEKSLLPEIFANGGRFAREYSSLSPFATSSLVKQHAIVAFMASASPALCVGLTVDCPSFITPSSVSGAGETGWHTVVTSNSHTSERDKPAASSDPRGSADFGSDAPSSVGALSGGSPSPTISTLTRTDSTSVDPLMVTVPFRANHTIMSCCGAEEVVGVTRAPDVPAYDAVTHCGDANPLPIGYVVTGELGTARKGVKMTPLESNCSFTKRDMKTAKKTAALESVRTLHWAGFDITAREQIEQHHLEQYRVIGPIPEGHEPKVSANHPDNVRAAVCNRHFKAKPARTEEGLAALRIASQETISSLMGELVKTGKLYDAEHMLSIVPESFKSKGWSKNRFMKIAHNNAVSAMNGYGKYSRSVTLKLNEANTKEKPRLIIAAGDKGTGMHLYDAALFEKALFGLPEFEERSIKHADPEEVSRRFTKFMKRYIDGYAGSMDFGAFDGSLDKEFRDLGENALVKLLGEFVLPGSPVMESAVEDRCRSNFTGAYIGSEAIRLFVLDMIRESGDRGTSVLNYLANRICFLAALFLEFKRVLGSAAAAITALRTWIKDVPGREIDLIAEGDDGVHFITRAFLEFVKSVPEEFSKRWIGHYTSMGFTLEPQGPVGAIEASHAFRPVRQRVEFISRIFVPIIKSKNGADTVATVAVIPKPRKLMLSGMISFSKGDLNTVAHTKWLALARNSLDVPLLYEFCMCMARYFESTATDLASLGTYHATAFEKFLQKLSLAGDSSTYNVLETQRMRMYERSDVVSVVREALYREIGITPTRQADLECRLRAVTSKEMAWDVAQCLVKEVLCPPKS